MEEELLKGAGSNHFKIKRQLENQPNYLTLLHTHPLEDVFKKPFKKDEIERYHYEEINRWESGELYSEDSIKVNDSVKFKTVNGRIVYGGGVLFLMFLYHMTPR